MIGENFNEAAAEFPEPFRLLVRETVESTNDEVRALAMAGAADGLIVLAERQTAGRGRRGAAWFSPAGESLAFSILVRPEEPKALWPRLALAAGVAVAEAIESFGVQAGIKWPNDVWIGQRKVAGILVEAGTDFAVVGIGLNVNTLGFPAEVSEIATSLRMETSREFSRAEVLSAIIHRFASRRQHVGDHFEMLISAVSQRCVLTGKKVTLITAGGPRDGTVEGIAAGGELMLRTDAGLERLIQADEIRLAHT
ncbi:MAG: biotin--[acetyl-CoA-carboxylase] ligase [Luteolibacter sp.]|uniref:biotin--[acetyl-CoA-carboxylase] ligase n=1 Tax=Luteolibacter sp. TaxID=1962973 RepID=UPI0032646859